MLENERKGFTPHFPKYENVFLLLPIIDGVKSSEVNKLIKSIMEQTGTPQDPVDWSEPDKWIPERLSGVSLDLARNIWEKSNKIVNPRHIRGTYWLIKRHNLAVEDYEGIIRLTEKGKGFLSKDKKVYKDLDESEGLLFLLTLITGKTRAQRKDLLPEWDNYMKKHSNYTSLSSIKSSLWQRLRNLTERGLINREGTFYVATNKGLEYVRETMSYDPHQEVFHSIASFNDKQKKKLREFLEKMDPYRFEHLIRDLLESMGYEDVTVTSQSGDKGVDVVATIQFGITTITEVVQVKRHKGIIGRSIVDQLRGALPYHEAIRGTLITLSDFSKSCKEAALFPGAAPITLINGKKLVALLFEHEIGITKQTINLHKVDESYFSEYSDQED